MVQDESSKEMGAAWQQAMETYASAMKVVQAGFAAAASAAGERMAARRPAPGSGAAVGGQPETEPRTPQGRADFAPPPPVEESVATSDGAAAAPAAPDSSPVRQADWYAVGQVAQQLESVTLRLERVEVLLAEILRARSDEPDVDTGLPEPFADVRLPEPRKKAKHGKKKKR
ncbi:MAG: hypothetical protein AB7O57_24040 [Hyphomicrobiaceae bacterium]